MRRLKAFLILMALARAESWDELARRVGCGGGRDAAAHTRGSPAIRRDSDVGVPAVASERLLEWRIPGCCPLSLDSSHRQTRVDQPAPFPVAGSQGPPDGQAGCICIKQRRLRGWND